VFRSKPGGGIPPLFRGKVSSRLPCTAIAMRMHGESSRSFGLVSDVEPTEMVSSWFTHEQRFASTVGGLQTTVRPESSTRSMDFAILVNTLRGTGRGWRRSLAAYSHSDTRFSADNFRFLAVKHRKKQYRQAAACRQTGPQSFGNRGSQVLQMSHSKKMTNDGRRIL